MRIDDNVIAQIAEDPVRGILMLCKLAEDEMEPGAQEWLEREYEVMFECFSALLSVLETFQLSYEAFAPELTGDMQQDAGAMWNFMTEVRKEYQGLATATKLDHMKRHFAVVLGKGFVYEFSKGDLERIQILLNELREQITASAYIEIDHKQRLLKRLERLQCELHKKMSDLDRFWGVVGDAGIVLRKFGQDAKPIVDRVREIADIVWRTQSRAEELPSDTPRPQLESDEGA